jgi:hypothetical protein
MENYVTPETIETVEAIIGSDGAAEVMAAKNYELGRRYFSFDLLEQRLRQVLMNFGQL